MIHLKLKELRKKSGFTQAQVADALHKSQNAYSLIEMGQSKLDAELIPAVCKLFKIYPSELFDYDDLESMDRIIYIKEVLKMLKSELDKKNKIIETLVKINDEKMQLEEQNENLKKLLNMIKNAHT